MSPEASEAAENLRVIRHLMERATIYRAISVPTALFGGVIAMALSAWLVLRIESAPARVTSEWFVVVWVIALVVVGLFNAVLIRRDARRRQEPFISAGMRLALISLTPPMAAGFITGAALALYRDDVLTCSLLWIIGYGLGLLATAEFAPASIRRLGWAFLVFGLILFLFAQTNLPTSQKDSKLFATFCMALAFGGLHLAYGLSVAVQTSRSNKNANRQPAQD